ncbi:MAG: CopG family transcriptional regulator, partial [Actinomycetota bacterium]
MLSERLQILIDQERLERLRGAAGERGVSVAQVIRDAIDQAIPADSPARQEALRQVLEAELMPVPDPGELKQQL